MNNNKIMKKGLVGKLQSGKTTSVNFLKEKYINHNTKRIHNLI